jgi:hypothetical protein
MVLPLKETADPRGTSVDVCKEGGDTKKKGLAYYKMGRRGGVSY